MKIRSAVDTLSKEKNVSKQVVIEAIQNSIKKSLAKKYPYNEIDVEYDSSKDELRVLKYKKVVDSELDMFDPETEIQLKEARKHDPTFEVDDKYCDEVTDDITSSLSRVDASFAKNIVNELVVRTEHELFYGHNKPLEGKIIKGIVQKVDKRGALVSFGKIDVIVPHAFLVPFEKLKIKQEYDFFLQSITMDKGQVKMILDRKSPHFVLALLTEEIPEIEDGTVIVESCIREAGVKTKVVVSTEQRMNPISVCIGTRGYKIEKIQQRMGSKERIDFIKYTEELSDLISGFLSGVKVKSVEENDKEIKVMVYEADLGRAKGFRDVNVRLASAAFNKKVVLI